MRIGFRVDANETIGQGHLMRCLTLGNEARRRGFDVVFFTKEPMASNIINSNNFKCVMFDSSTFKKKETDKFAELLKNLKISFLVTDHYQVTSEYFEIINFAKILHAYIDDLNQIRITADLIVNPGFGSEEEVYSSNGINRQLVLKGAPYFILRDEFKILHKDNIKITPQSVLITSGSTDLKGFSYEITEFIANEFTNLNINLLIGTGFVNVDKYIKLAKRYDSIKLISNNKALIINNSELKYYEMSDIILEIDFAFSAAGTTIFELLASGVPTASFQMVENQFNNYNRLKKAEVIVPIDGYPVLNRISLFNAVSQLLHYEERIQLIHKSSEILDGKGAERIIAVVEEMIANG